jgi:hypothetical protein
MNYKTCGIVMLAICLSGLVNCSSVPPVITVSPMIAVAAMSGTPQSHEVNGAFGSPLVAAVTTNGTPAGGVVVTFTAPATGASGTFADTGTATTTAKTDASGLATPAVFTADGVAGTYQVTALASGAPAPASFTLTNTIGAPAQIQLTSGKTQSAQINAAFAPFVVTVMDGGNNPVSDAIVTFTASQSPTGASGTFANGQPTETDTTNASGVATSTMFTANGISGPYTVTAAVGTVSATFNVTNSAGAPASITATSGTPQNAQIGTMFGAPLVVAVVDGASNPVSGVAVTFTAPATGASGTFSNTQATQTIATDMNGMASATFTANTVTGTYTVTATVAGLPPVSFSLTNQVASSTYVYYLSGQQASNYYALAGAVQIDGSSSVLGGVQDFNNPAAGITSPQPSGDAIMPGSAALAINATTGQGTLTLTTNNSNLGVAGVETLGVQFVNSKHALIIEFDGVATSSGSLDLQTATTLPSTGSASYAFTLSGVDSSFSPIAFGGVFSITGGTTLSGSFDTNDAGVVVAQPSQTAWSGTVSSPASLGRGTITGLTNPTSGSAVALNYYIVGPEVTRMIDIDTLATVGTNDSAVGSAFGQGTNVSGFTLGKSIFGIAGVPFGDFYAAAGMLSPSSGTFTGVADDNELTGGVQPPGVSITGSYSIPTNGYGNLTIAAGALGDVGVLGLYMTDPTLNLMDPNNTSAGSAVGGGLIADMDASAFVSGGTGVLIPQTDNSVASFTGSTNTYAFGAQDIDLFSFEFDFVGQGSFASGVLNGTGLVSDPQLDLTGDSPTNSGVTFSATPLPDPSNLGRYTMLSTNAVPNPLNLTIGGTVFPFNVVIYQASGSELFWIDQDQTTLGSEFLGSLQQEGSLSGIPAARKGAGNSRAKRKP